MKLTPQMIAAIRTNENVEAVRILLHRANYVSTQWTGWFGIQKGISVWDKFTNTRADAWAYSEAAALRKALQKLLDRNLAGSCRNCGHGKGSEFCAPCFYKGDGDKVKPHWTNWISKEKQSESNKRH